MTCLQQDILDWAAKHNAIQDIGFYSKSAWKNRNETVGTGAEFTMTAEGEPLRLLYYDGESKALNEFRRMVRKWGFWYEMGYHWSFHFYKREEEKT